MSIVQAIDAVEKVANQVSEALPAITRDLSLIPEHRAAVQDLTDLAPRLEAVVDQLERLGPALVEIAQTHGGLLQRLEELGADFIHPHTPVKPSEDAWPADKPAEAPEAAQAPTLAVEQEKVEEPAVAAPLPLVPSVIENDPLDELTPRPSA